MGKVGSRGNDLISHASRGSTAGYEDRGMGEGEISKELYLAFGGWLVAFGGE